MKKRGKSWRLKTSPMPILFIILFVLSLLAGDCMVTCLQATAPLPGLQRAAWAEETAEPNIQWFKQEMRIAEKYQEHREGIWGMSWAHFITMVFMFVFFIAAVIAMYIRNKRTREILASLLREK